MPCRIRELTSLKTLSVFIVGDTIGNQLDELEHLNLGGTLEIRHLERVQIQKNANLVQKQHLRDLVFHWDGYNSTYADLTTTMVDDEKVLEALQPHSNLATLEIQGFQGRELALWMNNMKNLTRIQIRDFKNCTRIPSFGDLPLLKFLEISFLEKLEYIVEKDDIGCQNSLGVKFPSLEHLHLNSMPNLKGLLKEDEMGEMFPNLRSLSIWRCPLLILTSTSIFFTPKNLKQVHCSPLILPSFSSKLANLSSLHLGFFGIDDTTRIPEVAFEGLCNLKTLNISNAKKGRVPEKWARDLNSLTNLQLFSCKIRSCLPEGWLGHLTSLENLFIWKCHEFIDLADQFKHLHFLKVLSLQYVDDMVCLPQCLQQIPSLQALSLTGLQNLTSLPDWLANLASLTLLHVEDCPKIQSLPSSIQDMTNLIYLDIWKCPELERRCEEANGQDWPKIAHIPHLSISYPF